MPKARLAKLVLPEITWEGLCFGSLRHPFVEISYNSSGRRLKRTFSGFKSVWMMLHIQWRKSNPIKHCFAMILVRGIGTPLYSKALITSRRFTPMISKTITKCFPLGPLWIKLFSNYTQWQPSGPINFGFASSSCFEKYYLIDFCHSALTQFELT